MWWQTSVTQTLGTQEQDDMEFEDIPAIIAIPSWDPWDPDSVKTKQKEMKRRKEFGKQNWWSLAPENEKTTSAPAQRQSLTPAYEEMDK